MKRKIEYLWVSEAECPKCRKPLYVITEGAGRNLICANCLNVDPVLYMPGNIEDQILLNEEARDVRFGELISEEM
jgi:uncharacterized protein YbaR (Trm112 family)